MKWHIFRHSLLNLFGIIALLTGFTSCSTEVPKEDSLINHSPEFLSNFLAEEALGHASLGILVKDVKTGEVFINHNENQTLVPASVLKILIAGAALETFGPDLQFETKLMHDGTVDRNGILHGNLIIKGGGDPALASPRFEDYYKNLMARLRDAVIEMGIKEIDGEIIGDASLMGALQIPDTWIWEDIGNYYGATATGLNVFENTYKLSFSSGKAGSLTRVKGTNPQIPNLTFDNKVRASSNNRDNGYIFGSYLSGQRELRGTIPANRKNFSIKGAIPDPAYLAAFQFSEQLKKASIHISGEPKSKYTKTTNSRLKPILTIKSPPLSEIIFQLNMKSINLYAESLLQHLSFHKNKTADYEEACDALSDFWKSKGMNTEGMFLEDGSGLSRANSITPTQLGFVLSYMKDKSKYSEEFIQSLPVAGTSGSLKRFGKGTNILGEFRAKSGSMSRVMNYAGYLECENKEEVLTVIMVNNYTCSNTEMKKLLESFLSDLYDHSF